MASCTVEDNQADQILLNFINGSVPTSADIPDFNGGEIFVSFASDDVMEDMVFDQLTAVASPGVVNVIAEELYPESNTAVEDLLTLSPADLDYKCPQSPYENLETYSGSPASSESSAYTIDSIESFTDVPINSPVNDEVEATTLVSPSEVFGERKRKRGRKPKSEAGLYTPPAKKQRKVRIYEIEKPFADVEKERKRLNAVNAKKHRDLQKQIKEKLQKELADVMAERDSLRMEVEKLRKREVDLSNQVNDFKAKAFSLISGLEKTS